MSATPALRGGLVITAQHYGINPRLVSLLTSQPLSALPTRLTPSMLPSRYTVEAHRKLALFDREHPENFAMLTCLNCGRKGKYDLGSLVIDPRLPDPISRLQYTAYFRCKHCNAAGNWDMRSTLHLGVLATAVMLAGGMEDDRVILGRAALFDGFEGRFATDSEEHFLDRLTGAPNDGWLWNRLGNLYRKSERPDLAIVAFEASLRHDPKQCESHFSLGQLLRQLGHADEAGTHLRRTLVLAREYEALSPLQLRNFIVDALKGLLLLRRQSDGAVPFLPTREDSDDAWFSSTASRAMGLIPAQGPDSLDSETLGALANAYIGPARIAAAEIRDQAARRETASASGEPYVAGKKIGRNTPCPCGSGRKYKRCCGRDA